jgi:hypothetical protein
MNHWAEHRHPQTRQMPCYFDYAHLPKELQAFSDPLHGVAWEMVRLLPDGPELTAGLRKLLEAKDCFVRAGLDTMGEG